MKQYQKPEMRTHSFDTSNIVMTSGNAYHNIRSQLEEDFGVDEAAVVSRRYENWGEDIRFE